MNQNLATNQSKFISPFSGDALNFDNHINCWCLSLLLINGEIKRTMYGDSCEQALTHEETAAEPRQHTSA